MEFLQRFSWQRFVIFSLIFRSILSATIPRAKSSVLMALNSPTAPSVPPPKSHPNSATEVRLQNHSSAVTSDSHSQRLF